ncbi:MAG: hypothetical protein HUK20_06120 [Fibrobacter sp.]|nr:hypothetical protein [Fibrobacter sp.]
MIGSINNSNDIFNTKDPRPIPASLFYRRGKNVGISQQREGSSDFDYFPFDLFISEKHRLSFNVGDHPLQNGCVVSDHVYKELQEVTLEGLYTNHPVNKDGKVEIVHFGGEFSNSAGSLSNTAIKKFDELKNLAKKMMPVRLVTSLEIYPKMIITSLDYSRDEKSGSSIRFTMQLREINIVSLKNIKSNYYFTPDEMKNAKDRLIASKAKKGKRSADEAKADELAKLLKVEVAQ